MTFCWPSKNVCANILSDDHLIWILRTNFECQPKQNIWWNFHLKSNVYNRMMLSILHEAFAIGQKCWMNYPPFAFYKVSFKHIDKVSGDPNWFTFSWKAIANILRKCKQTNDRTHNLPLTVTLTCFHPATNICTDSTILNEMTLLCGINTNQIVFRYF